MFKVVLSGRHIDILRRYVRVKWSVFWGFPEMSLIRINEPAHGVPLLDRSRTATTTATTTYLSLRSHVAAAAAAAVVTY